MADPTLVPVTTKLSRACHWKHWARTTRLTNFHQTPKEMYSIQKTKVSNRLFNPDIMENFH